MRNLEIGGKVERGDTGLRLPQVVGFPLLGNVPNSVLDALLSVSTTTKPWDRSVLLILVSPGPGTGPGGFSVQGLS